MGAQWCLYLGQDRCSTPILCFAIHLTRLASFWRRLLWLMTLLQDCGGADRRLAGDRTMTYLLLKLTHAHGGTLWLLLPYYILRFCSLLLLLLLLKIRQRFRVSNKTSVMDDGANVAIKQSKKPKGSEYVIYRRFVIDLFIFVPFIGSVIAFVGC